MIYYVAAVTAIFGYALLPVLAKKLQADIPSFAFIAITMAFLTLFSTIASFIHEKEFSLSGISMPTFSFLNLCALVNFLAFAVMLFAISKIPIVEYQLIALLTPIFGGILAYFILSEGLSIKYFVGLIFIGVVYELLGQLPLVGSPDFQDEILKRLSREIRSE